MPPTGRSGDSGLVHDESYKKHSAFPRVVEDLRCARWSRYRDVRRNTEQAIRARIIGGQCRRVTLTP